MQTVKRFTLATLLLSLIASPVLEAYYGPYIGRFLQRDPAGQGVNWYAYAANNPMMFIDPTGMFIVLPDGTEIREVPEKDADGNYIKPEGLSPMDSLFWDALFTLGIDGRGIAGSWSAGGMLHDIINCPIKVTINPATGMDPGVRGTA